jgi:hypothetical protein
MIVGHIKYATGSSGKDPASVRAKGLAETKLLSGKLQFGYTRHGNKTPANLACSWDLLQRLPVCEVPPILLPNSTEILSATKMGSNKKGRYDIDTLWKTGPLLRAS